MNTIDNENPTPEEETTPADSIAGSESIDPTEEEALSDSERALFDTIPSSSRNPFTSWSDFHWLVALALVVVALMGFAHTYIQENKGAEVPVTVHGKGGSCITQYWHVPERYMEDDLSFQQTVAAAKADGEADFRGSESCNIQIVR